MGRDEGESLLDGSLKARDGEPCGLTTRGRGREISEEAYGFIKGIVCLFNLVKTNKVRW